jgi:hypothetical protein
MNMLFNSGASGSFKSVKLFYLMQKIFRHENNIDRNLPLTWGISLDEEGSILSIEMFNRGRLDAKTFLPSSILNIPLQKQAAGFVLIRNHTGGHLAPNETDKAIAARLIQCGELLRLPFLDYLIINGTSYYSFKDAGIMDELAFIPGYYPEVPEEEDIAEAELETVLKDREELTSYIVWLMTEANYPLEEIMTRTGLSLDAILNLEKFYREEEIDPDSHFESTNGGQALNDAH